MTSEAELIRELLDKQAIAELVVKVARAIDRCDDELFLSCYWEDAHDDHGVFSGSPAGLLDHLHRRTMVPEHGPLQHAVTNLLVEIRGDEAFSESYGESRVVGGDGEVSRGLCRYVDRFERRGGEWRIIDRRVILESARPGFDVSSFVQGSRSPDDPSYER